MNEPADLRSDLPESPSFYTTHPWMRWIIDYNPLYLCSAGMLLYGLYRVSNDPNFLKSEIGQLTFNFLSLQGYALLLAGTVLFLGRRRLWHDAGVLVGVEHLLVFVPFLLVSQAALIGRPWVWLFCVGGAAVAAARTAVVRRGLAGLNFPDRVASIGLAMLVVNAALPMIYQGINATKVETRPVHGPAFDLNAECWLWLLPALAALANLLPRWRSTGPHAIQHGGWPAGLFGLWFAGTAVHLYSLGYVYDFDLRPEWLAPTLWVLAWSGWRVAAGLSPELRSRFAPAALVLPLVATFPALTEHGGPVFLSLTLVNTVAFGALWLRGSNRIAAARLLAASIGILLLRLPDASVNAVWTGHTGMHCLLVVAAIVALILTPRSRDPRFGLLGAVTVAALVITLLHGTAMGVQWGLQSGIAYLLLHSLRWVDAAYEGAALLRGFAAASWVVHSLVWTHCNGTWWMPGIPALAVIALYVAAEMWAGRWERWIVPAAAGASALCGPAQWTSSRLPSAPPGLLMVIASFVLFGLGTVAALARQGRKNAE